MSSNREKVQREVNRALGYGTLDPDAGDIERFSTAKPRGGPRDKSEEGVVLVRRDHKHQPWVVWRWITVYDSGEVVGGPSGAIVWSGGYYGDHDRALEDYRKRSGL